MWGEDDITLASGYSAYSYSIKYEGQDKDFYQITSCKFHVNKLSGSPAKKDISSAQVEVSGEYTYFGNAITPTVKVVLGGETLNFGFDYDVICENNTLAGDATLKIVGKGLYQGQISRTFQIQKAEWPKSVPSDIVYAGKNVTNLRNVDLGADGWVWQNADLSLSADNFSATAIYNGADKANFVNITKQVTIKILGKKDISSVSLTLDETNFVYDGQAKLPNVVAKDGEKELKVGSDFTVQYSDNIGAGQGRVIVKGQNDYMGSKTLTFTIERAERTDFSVTLQGWNYGDKNVPNPSVSGEVELGEVTYTYSTSENGTYGSDVPTNAGTYWVKAEIAQSQNYNSATAKAQFVISSKAAKGLDASLENDTFVYDTTSKTPKAVIKDGLATLVAGVDYDVEYRNNKFAGKGTAIVTFKSNYKGTTEFTFTINKAERPNVDTTIECDKDATTLADVTLPEGFVWNDDSIIISGDKMTAKATYRGADASSYKTTELIFEIIVSSQDSPNTPSTPDQKPDQDTPSTPGGETSGGSSDEGSSEGSGETSGETSGGGSGGSSGEGSGEGSNDPSETPGDNDPSENPSENPGDSGDNGDDKNGCASCGTMTFGSIGGIGGGLGGGIAGTIGGIVCALSALLIFPLKKKKAEN